MLESRSRARSFARADFAARLAQVLSRRPRQRLDSSSALRAAVLVPLFVERDDLHVLFTKRADTLRYHRGQVAFPGGQHKPEVDASLLATAMREAHEEIGLRLEHVQVLGALDDIETFRTNFVIAPFVGLIPHPYVFRPDPGEVAEIFSVPLANLEDPAARREELWELKHRRVKVSMIRYREHVIWGATERMTRNLIEVLAILDGNNDAP